ncbi:arylsulfatase [Maribacter aurantiacus]|uniref:Arylsulfatase n=2 Tax=Maribacter aurantiacus TaxID=1882343 RepID=A0A5R8MC54_9FLAO|nr:arylsulfatase [Maribacter aurantiacus]
MAMMYLLHYRTKNGQGHLNGMTNLYSLLLVLIFSISIINGQEKPNVILILADDMALGDLGNLNGRLNKTPHLDQLMDSGMFFSSAYSASAVCTPARAALLTGKYPHKTGAVTLNMERFPELSRVKLNERTIGDLFREQGYSTGLIGKWHIGDGEKYHPLRRGFQEFVGFKGYDVPKDYYNYRLDFQGIYREVTNEYLTDVLTENAIEFVEEHQNEPFFLHLAYYTPHRPLSAPQDLIDFYLSKGFDLNTATIYAMIEVMDKGIGKLMQTLKQKSLLKNTIIVFASDNGPDPLVGERYNLNQRGTKYTINEGGIHVPLIFYWEGKIKPSIQEQIVHFTDILPTLIDLCNLTIPDSISFDGGSIGPLLLGSSLKIELPQYRYWQWNRGIPYYSHNAAIRDGDWKLVFPYVTREMVHSESDSLPMLYNIKDDPYEKKNLSKMEKTRYNTMWTELNQWGREVEMHRLTN